MTEILAICCAFLVLSGITLQATRLWATALRCARLQQACWVRER
ncbi:MAG: hypothetical protein ACJAVM_000901 [Sulfitobacter sp.]|jgi:hypothetical protein